MSAAPQNIFEKGFEQMKQQLGARGEQTAVNYLKHKGYTILARNYRSPAGEIDIICSNAQYLTFVEVKTRRSTRYGMPREAVDARKQQRIIQTAQYWLMEHPTQLQPRFDVAEVFWMPDEIGMVRLLTNAFEVNG